LLICKTCGQKFESSPDSQIGLSDQKISRNFASKRLVFKMAKTKARFLQPMLLLPTQKLPEGPDWLYEVKLDGYRILGIKSRGTVQLRSRRDNDFTAQYPLIAAALRALPDDTVVDGEVVALDNEGRPSFNLLQNLGSSKARLVYFVFDVLILNGRDVMRETLAERRILLEEQILKRMTAPIGYSAELKASLSDLIESAKSQGLEGLVAKRRSSRYESGQRTGSWRKMRINRAQEFVIGGYTPLGESFDALVFGVFEKGKLIYVARTRNGFTPATRRQVFKHLKPLENSTVPLCESPGGETRQMGSGIDRCENEGMPMGETGSRGAV